MKILIIKHGALGDLIQSDGVLRDIRLQFSDAEIVLLTEPKFHTLMVGCPHIDRVIEDPRLPIWKVKQLFMLFSRLNREHFDMVIDLQNSDRTRFYQKWLLKQAHWIYRHRLSPKPTSGLQGQIEMLEENAIPVISANSPDVSWLAGDVSDIMKYQSISTPYIALIPGCSSVHPEKRWPYYDLLAEALLADGYEVVHILGPDELELAKTLPGHTLIDKDKLLSWSEIAGLLQGADFVIGNDTGPSHVASCLNRPGLALFGAHTLATRAQMKRGKFDVLQVNDLVALSVSDILSRIQNKLPKRTGAVSFYR